MAKYQDNKYNASFYALKLSVILILIFLIAGCAGFSKKFWQTKRVDLAPFAEQTLAVVGDIGQAWEYTEYVHLDDYADAVQPEIKKMEELRLQINPLFRGIIAYSIQIVTLSESKIPEPEKTQSLANFVSDLESPVINQGIVKLNITQEQFEKILESIRQEKEYMDGLMAAQPLVNEVARYGGEILSQLSDVLEETGLGINNAIEERYKHLLGLVGMLEERQRTFIKGLELVQAYALGDTDIQDRLRALPIAGIEELVPARKLTAKEVDTIGDDLLDRLSMTQNIFGQLDQNLQTYRETKEELNAALRNLRKQLRRARYFLIAWSRAHHKMASGTTNPAEWFDVKKGAVDLFDTGKKLIF